MKNSMLLMRPKQTQQALQTQQNIFQKARLSSTLPAINRSSLLQRQQKIYDFVGPTQFKMRKFFSTQVKNTTIYSKNQNEKMQNLEKKNKAHNPQASIEFSKLANTTINRDTILSKLTKHQQVEATKQKRNMNRHKQYQSKWNAQAMNMKRLLNKKNSSLLEENQKVIIEDNPDKIDIINNNIVDYWEMSLRNHNPILKRHIKGHRYGQVQLEQLLQRTSGIKQVESSIPKLPLQSLKNVKTRELSLTGRSKSVMESQSLTERSSFNYSQRNQNLNQEEVYLINYEGQKKWQGTQNFY